MVTIVLLKTLTFNIRKCLFTSKIDTAVCMKPSIFIPKHQIQSDILYVNVKCVALYEKFLNITDIFLYNIYSTYMMTNFLSNMKRLSDCEVRLCCSWTGLTWIHYYVTLVHVLSPICDS